MEFRLEHKEGILIAVVIIDNQKYEKDVTEYFTNENAHDDWLDFRIARI